jgi:alpha-mannosidase
MSRQAEVKILTAERLAALESISGGENHEASLQKSWKNLLVAQHHDIQICGILEDSRKFLPASIGISDSIIRTSMNFISSRMNGGNLAQVSVFNPLSWSRSEWISVKFALPANIHNFAIKKGEKQVPYEILSFDKKTDNKTNNIWLSIKVVIPPLTFQSYSVVASKIIQNPAKTIEFDQDSMRIKTPFWIIKLDKNGGFSSISNRATGKTILQNRRSGYFEGVIDGHSIVSSGKWDTDSIILNKNQIILHEDGKIGSIPYKIEMRLTNASPRIDFMTKFHFSNEKIGRVTENKREVASAFLHEEKLRFKVFPSLGIGTTGIRDLPFTIAETENKYIEGNYWTALADGHSGIAFFNLGNMGSLHEDDGSFSIPLAYSMFYIWKTVILDGDFTYEFALYPFEGKWDNAELHHEALNYNYPIIINSSKRGSGALGDQFQPFYMESSNIILSALFTQGGKPFIRFYESQGSKDVLKLKFQPSQARLTEVDLLGNEQDSGNSQFFFRPWQIKTFKLDISGNK